jgi:hypothetical protein
MFPTFSPTPGGAAADCRPLVYRMSLYLATLSVPRRRSQVVRQRSAKPPFVGSIPTGAFLARRPSAATPFLRPRVGENQTGRGLALHRDLFPSGQLTNPDAASIAVQLQVGGRVSDLQWGRKCTSP